MMLSSLYTIGYTKKSLSDFVHRLQGANVQKIVDIRRRNTSQLAGFAKKDDLAFILNLLGIEYEHAPELAPTDELLDAYHRDKDWDAFESQYKLLLADGNPVDIVERTANGHRSVCLLCTEDQPEHCHRRLVAEYVMNRRPGTTVRHL